VTEEGKAVDQNCFKPVGGKFPSIQGKRKGLERKRDREGGKVLWDQGKAVDKLKMLQAGIGGNRNIGNQSFDRNKKGIKRVRFRSKVLKKRKPGGKKEGVKRGGKTPVGG